MLWLPTTHTHAPRGGGGGGVCGPLTSPKRVSRTLAARRSPSGRCLAVCSVVSVSRLRTGRDTAVVGLCLSRPRHGAEERAAAERKKGHGGSLRDPPDGDDVEQRRGAGETEKRGYDDVTQCVRERGNTHHAVRIRAAGPHPSGGGGSRLLRPASVD